MMGSVQSSEGTPSTLQNSSSHLKFASSGSPSIHHLSNGPGRFGNNFLQHTVTLVTSVTYHVTA